MADPAGGISFELHVRPGGRRDAVEGRYDGVLAIRVTAPPADGRANEAVCRLLAAAFGVRRSAVQIVGGATARRKRVHIEGDDTELRVTLARLLGD